MVSGRPGRAFYTLLFMALSPRNGPLGRITATAWRVFHQPSGIEIHTDGVRGRLIGAAGEVTLEKVHKPLPASSMLDLREQFIFIDVQATPQQA
jgi:hypothetical protein